MWSRTLNRKRRQCLVFPAIYQYRMEEESFDWVAPLCLILWTRWRMTRMFLSFIQLSILIWTTALGKDTRCYMPSMFRAMKTHSVLDQEEDISCQGEFCAYFVKFVSLL